MRDFIFIKPTEDLTWERYIEISNNLTKINKDDVSYELMEYTSVFAYYNGILNTYKFELDRAQHIIDQSEATIRSICDQDYRAHNNSKPTDKYLEMKVNTNEEYQTFIKGKTKLDYKYNLMKGLVHSLEFKKDCLVQLSSNNRAEAKLYS